MKKILLWSFVALMVVAFALTPEPGRAQTEAQTQAQTQVQKLIEQGSGQLKKQQFDEAIATFKKALKEEPNSALIYNLLGMAYRHKNHQVRNQELRKQEIAAFQKAIKIDPTYWVALINLGTTYYYAGDKAKAAPLFKKALTLNPNHPEKAQLEKMIQEGWGKP
jgi:Ca-activated chloride channel homolog